MCIRRQNDRFAYLFPIRVVPPLVRVMPLLQTQIGEALDGRVTKEMVSCEDVCSCGGDSEHHQYYGAYQDLDELAGVAPRKAGHSP